MSKNIDDVVDSILPEAPDYQSEGYYQGIDWARDLLKQAIQEKKLVVPLSEEAILDILTRRKLIHKSLLACGIKDRTKEQVEEFIREELAKTIYEAQFNRGEQ